MRARSVAALLGVLLSACLGGDELGIDVGEGADDPRFDRLRARLAIEVRPGPDGFSGSSTCDALLDESSPCCGTSFCSARGLGTQLYLGCREEQSPERDRSSCGRAVGDADAAICAAQRLIQIVQNPGEQSIRAGGANGGELTIGPQDAESNSELGLEAVRLLSSALAASGNALARVPRAGGAPPVCTRADFERPAGTGEFAATTLGEELAHFYAESLQVATDARDVVLHAGAAVSDSELSRATDRSEAALMRLAPFASRTASAHALVGGAHRLLALPEIGAEGLFDRPPLTRGGQQALQLLRTAGLDPRLVADPSITHGELIIGSARVPEAAPARASFRYRLSRILGEEELASADAARIYQRLGVDEAALGEARAWLAAEIRAFDRPVQESGPRRARTMPSERLADGTTSDFPIFAATRLPPGQPQSAFWSAVVRYDPTPIALTSPGLPAWTFGMSATGALPPGATWGDEGSSGGMATLNRDSGRTYASVLEDATLRARVLIGAVSPLATDSTTLRDVLLRMRDTLAGPLPEGLGGSGSSSITGSASTDGTLLGRARICGANRASEAFFIEVDLSVSGVTSADGWDVFLGQEGLDCAVRGTIDGVGCTPEELADLRAVTSTPFRAASGTSGRFFTIVAPAPGTGPDALLSAYYVVRRAPSATGAPVPGEYDPLIGFVVAPVPSGTVSCIGSPIVPDLDRRVGELVGISTGDHGRSEFYCAGLRDDLRIPLENELTDDRDDVESSWRHYLAVARAAASSADLLGEDLVRLGVEMDARAEAQADQLEALCGVRLNITSFAGDLPLRVRPPTSGTDCPTDYRFIAESRQCVLDPIQHARTTGALGEDDAHRLEECIGSDATIPWAALGDQPVCMWQYGDDSTTLCMNASAEHPCPVVATDAASDADCSVPPELVDGEAAQPIFVPVEAALGLFVIPYGDLDTDTGSNEDLPCEALARLRARTAAPAGSVIDGDALSVLASGLLRQLEFARYARRLGWEPSAGDFSRVTYGGTTIAATGWFGAPACTNIDSCMWPVGRNIRGMHVFDDDLCGLDAPARLGDAFVANRFGLFCLNGVPRDGSGSNRRVRARANDLLARAVIAARLIAGESLAGVSLPYYPRANAYRVVTQDLAPELLREDFFEARIGDLVVDQHEHSTEGDELVSFDEIEARAQWITLESACSDPPCEGAEWSHCYYEEGGCAAFFDDALATDGDLRNIPLLVRRVGPGIEQPRAGEVLRHLFDTSRRFGALHEHIEQLAARSLRQRVAFSTISSGYSADVPLASLSDYFHGEVRLNDVDGGSPDGYTCRDRYAACMAAHTDTLDVRSSADANHAYISAPGGGLTAADILNGMELACVAARIDSPDPNFGCDEPEPIRSIRDLLSAEAFLQCKAENIEAQAGTGVIQGLPRRVASALRESGGGRHGTGSGEIAARVDELRAAFIALSDARHEMADQLRNVAADIRELRSVIAASEMSNEIETLSLVSTFFNQLTNCALAASAISWSEPTSYVGPAMACANATVQIGLATEISRLRSASEAERLQGTFAAFDSRVTGHMRAMSGSAISVRTALEGISAALARLDAIRSEARNALGRALFLEGDGTDTHFALSSVYRARYDTQLARYLEAHDRAVRTAFIARRAVEQRLGMPLETITDALPTVAAPSEWADDVCTIPTIDYDTLRGALAIGEAEAPVPPGPTGYAGTFVGDYVDRLEQVVESYNFVFPFRDGTDTAVISLRDDVFNVRAPCSALTPNLLLQSNHLDVIATSARPGWVREGCGLEPLPNPIDGEAVVPHCVSARALSPEEDPTYVAPEGEGSDLGRPRGFRVRFGAGGSAALAQYVTLGEGRYRLSWYGRVPAGALPDEALDPSAPVLVRAQDGARLDDPSRRVAVFVGEGWQRFHTFFDVGRSQEVAVVIRPSASSDASTSVDVGSLMLEDVTRTVLGDPWRMVADPRGAGTLPLAELAAPGPFYETAATRERVLRVCPDHSGESFRADAWTYGCTRVCPDGYDGTCDERIATSRCYYQTSLSIDSDVIERSLTGTPTGFAGGNYNYRIEQIGVNLVGTEIRACADGSPGCFGSGNVSYSLLHTGSFVVRNARGEQYDAPLFPGRIEGARALVAERYVTNPISSADQTLIGPYTRVDFRGRPLGGSLILRVWDEPSLDFDRVEDVQIVLGYRYWQHQR